jgi:hypothetical protein
LCISHARVDASPVGRSFCALAHSADQDGVERSQLSNSAGHAACTVSAFQPGKSCHATGTQRDPSRLTLAAGTDGLNGGVLEQAARMLTVAAASHRKARAEASVQESLAGWLFIVDSRPMTERQVVRRCRMLPQARGIGAARGIRD